MAQHRIRLSDDDIALILSCLRARRAGVGAASQAAIDKLAWRLMEGRPGNPIWLMGQLRELRDDEYKRSQEPNPDSDSPF